MTLITSAHAASGPQILEQLGSHAQLGLSELEALERLKTFGFNELQEAPPYPSWKRFVSQFNQLLVWMLVAAGAISLLFGEWIESVYILSIVILNGVIGFIQEEKAMKSN